MFSYEFYKVLHVFSIIAFFSLAGAQILSEGRGKLVKILTGVFTFLIFVAGMGLIARIGVSHGEGWPVWLWAKMAIWLTSAVVVPVFAKRIKQKRALAWALVMLLAFAGAYIGATHA